MSRQNLVFPVDIFALKAYGVERWRNEFYWPVSDEEFAMLGKEIEDSLARRINMQPEEIGELFLIQRSLSFEYGNFLHAIKVIEAVRQEEREPLYSDRAPWYKEILEECLADSATQKIRNTNEILYNHNVIERIESAAKKLVKNIIYAPGRLGLNHKKEETQVCGSMSPLMRRYIKKRALRVSFTSAADWMNNMAGYKIPLGLENRIRAVSGDYASQLRTIAANNRITLSNNHTAYLKRLTENALTDAAKLIHMVKGGAKMAKSFRLLVHNMGHPLHKAVSITLRRKGGRVTTFTHGGFIGLYDTPTPTFSEFSLSDEFIAYTGASSRLFEKIKANRSPLRGNRVVITSAESPEYLNLWRREKRRPLAGRIKRVMIIGYPHCQWRQYHTAASLSFMQLDLELRIAEILRNKGYEVLYKVHTDRVPESDGIFDGIAKVINKGYFQDYLDMADAYIFGSIRTSAFSIALCTRKPIIAFKMDKEPFEPFSEPLGLLKRRCAFIPCTFDDRNRIIFDESAFLEALARKPAEPDNEFIERYMFP